MKEDIKKFKPLYNELRQFGFDFEVQTTKKTRLIKFRGHRYVFSTSHIPKRLLGLMTKTKADIKRNLKDKKVNDQYKVKRLKYRNSIAYKGYYSYAARKALHLPVFCCDLNSAYVTAALNLGYISKEVYELLMEEKVKYDKGDHDINPNRLLGMACGGSKTISKYKNGREVENDIKYAEYEFVWLDICKYIDELMREVFQSLKYFWNQNKTKKYRSAVFYYVDMVCIIDNDLAPAAQRIMDEMFGDKGFRYTVEKDEVLRYDKDRKMIYMASGKPFAFGWKDFEDISRYMYKKREVYSNVRDES